MMIFFNIVLFLICSIVFADNGNRELAKVYFQQGEMQSALDEFERIHEKNYNDWFLGAQIYKEHKDYALALHALKQSKKCGTLKHGLMVYTFEKELCNLLQTDEPNWIQELIHLFVKNVGTYGWQLLIMLTVWAILGAYFLQADRRFFMPMVLFLCGSVWSLHQCVLISTDALTVQSSQVLVRPEQYQLVSHTVKPGEYVSCMSQNNGWTKIIHKNGKGWIKNEAILFF